MLELIDISLVFFWASWIFSCYQNITISITHGEGSKTIAYNSGGMSIDPSETGQVVVENSDDLGKLCLC